MIRDLNPGIKTSYYGRHLYRKGDSLNVSEDRSDQLACVAFIVSGYHTVVFARTVVNALNQLAMAAVYVVP